MKWPTVKLKDVCELITDGVHNSPEYCSTGIPMLDSKHIGENFFIDDTKPEKFISPVTDAMLSTRCKPSTEDVLISSRGSIGKMAIVRRNQNFNIMGNIILIRAAKNITPKFLAYTLSNKVSHLISIANGVAQKGLYLNQIRSLEILLPPLAEQERIAAVLDKAAEIKAKREQAVTKLNELSASAFNECFLKSTNQTVAKIKSLVVKRRLSETNDTNVWSLALDQIESNGGEVLSRVIVNRAKLGTSTYYFEPDVVLYSKLRPYLNKVVIPDSYGYATTELVPLYCNKEIILPSFMAAYLRSPRFVDFANTNSAGAKMPRVIMDKFWDYEMVVPNLEVQNAFQKLHEKCIAMKMQLKRSIEKQDSLIQSLQYQAFTTGF